jgi:hypothetical protein
MAVDVLPSKPMLAVVLLLSNRLLWHLAKVEVALLAKAQPAAFPWFRTATLMAAVKCLISLYAAQLLLISPRCKTLVTLSSNNSLDNNKSSNTTTTPLLRVVLGEQDRTTFTRLPNQQSRRHPTQLPKPRDRNTPLVLMSLSPWWLNPNIANRQCCRRIVNLAMLTKVTETVAAVVVLDESWTGSVREARKEATRKASVRLVDLFALSTDFEQYCSALSSFWSIALSAFSSPVFLYPSSLLFAPSYSAALHIKLFLLLFANFRNSMIIASIGSSSSFFLVSAASSFILTSKRFFFLFISKRTLFTLGMASNSLET